jgi:hypothetical protein
VLNALELSEADPWLKKTAILLNRRFPTGAVYTDSLLRRNYRQVRDSERVYATTWFNRFGQPQGGTGWTVTMAILLGIPEIYVHNKKTDYWMKWDGQNPNEADFSWEWSVIDRPGTPYGFYTGIGSHDLEWNQNIAIRSLYE